MPSDTPTDTTSSNPSLADVTSLADNVIELRRSVTHESGPVAYSLSGLTRRMMSLERGTGMLIPAQPDWNDRTVKNLRSRIGTIAHRCMRKTGDNFPLRSSIRGFEIWRLPPGTEEPGEPQ